MLRPATVAWRALCSWQLVASHLPCNILVYICCATLYSWLSAAIFCEMCFLQAFRSGQLTSCEADSGRQLLNNPTRLHILAWRTQAVDWQGRLAWSPVVVMQTSKPDLPVAAYLRITTAAGKVRCPNQHTLWPASCYTRFWGATRDRFVYAQQCSASGSERKVPFPPSIRRC
jgi:hypothetical protein